MALINIEAAIGKVRTFASKAAAGQGLELLTYKRNRGVSFLKLEDGGILVRERGYQVQELTVAATDLVKILKAILKREFPRSRKVRLYHLAGPEEMQLIRKKI